MEMRIAGTERESVVDGPGLRFVVFAQGCRHGCRGCHNPDTWNQAGGALIKVEDLLEQIKTARLIKGVTFSGGEPFLQAAQLAWLGREVKKLGLDLITFTGYTWEVLLALAEEDNAVRELLLVSDYIVDGPFIQEERDLELPFRGSRNQRVIDAVRSRQAGVVIEAGFS
ncbi:anaerobic ribonucleoside-triphosphate reductase activating protein [Pelotomaculum propionicicum]|uniref:Anaerobic ribonucleoside-triphosphate reductase-activating protein n=1 Tax=Pelotomaculum propionicicum TaxID=258475 RepID=A0A4Y7RXY2_9FIRM|nr:anaerobic ribonucleoside-triphosphate reductase activating protein [Pelotomaculum propionicicum]NLI12882.1 anaerobic ribonucleoside-triphosphate reductase activating protein [Peptococcaceae bacterium]TEB13157.1 Pyruvate formate-lyase 1-activating enzyme [Pelotomaculum propionicicum]